MSKIKEYAAETYGEEWETALEDYLADRYLTERQAQYV